jgi:regulatory protein
MEGKITAISPGKRPGSERSNVYLDGKFAFSLDDRVIVKKQLKVGGDIAPADVRMLSGEDHLQSCLNAAFRFLSFRPRSEAEVRERLARHGYTDEDVEAVMPDLRRLNLLDDAAFAEFWKENRNSFKPRSQRMVKLELRRKGVDTEVINQAVSDIDDSENALAAARTRARTIPKADYQVFRNRLGAYLQRRGFSYGVVDKAVKQAWQEAMQEAEKKPNLD